MLQGYKMLSTLTPHGFLSITGLCKNGVFFLPRGCSHLCWTAAGPGGRRGCVSGERHFWGKQERKLGWILSACHGSALAQLPPPWAAGAVQPSRMGRAAGSLLYPSKCFAWSHDISQQNLPGVKGKRETERGQETKGGIKSKNVPWSFLQQNAEKVISNFFHLRDEATK